MCYNCNGTTVPVHDIIQYFNFLDSDTSESPDSFSVSDTDSQSSRSLEVTHIEFATILNIF